MRLNEPGPAMWTTHSRALLLLSTGRAAAAVEVLEPVAAYAQSINFRGIRAIPWQPDHIEGLARTGRTGEAEDLLRSWADGIPADADDWHRAIVARCRVLVRGDAADELVELIEGGALRLTPIEEARCRLVAGGALRRRRRPAASHAMIQAAAETFGRLGAAGWQATALAALNGPRQPAASSPASANLTLQEMRVAQEIAAGATNREAAARLFCSPKTVEYHLTRVYSKLGVRSRTALAGHPAMLGVHRISVPPAGP
jgi:DNA-binding CsgD family transcriptional regulator